LATLLADKSGAKVELRSGDRGSFEVFVDGRKIYSKLATGRFPDSDEILKHLV
jgi:selT/selW/selH-like putative selenoprotein